MIDQILSDGFMGQIKTVAESTDRNFEVVHTIS